MEPVDLFLKDIEAVEKDFIATIQKISSVKDLSRTEIFNLIAELNFFDVLEKSGYTSAVGQYLNSYDKIIRDIANEAISQNIAIQDTDIQHLSMLKNLDADWLLQRGQSYSSEFKSAMFRNMIGDRDIKHIREILPTIQAQVEFKPAWFETAISTSYFQFNSNAMKEIYSDTPEQKFRLDHPKDNRTRHQCLHAIEIMENNPDGFTVSEIDNGALGQYKFKNEMINYSFIIKGGFNCRGRWRPIV